MTATFDQALATDTDKIRSDLGGAITTLPASDPLLTDEHIDAVLTWKGSHDAAVSYLAQELVVRFAGKPTRIKVGDVDLDYGARLGVWQALANRTSSSGGLSFVSANYTGDSATDEYARPPVWP